MSKRYARKHAINRERARNRERTFTTIKIILWPLKALYTVVSWVIKGIILGLEQFINVFRSSFAKKNAAKKSNTSNYVPFRIVETIKGSFYTFENFLIKNPSTIGIIIGARGTGKSAFGLKLLENLHELSNKRFYAMGIKDLPEWIHVVETLDEIENESFVLIDEGGILFSSRKSFSDANNILSELLLIARHKDLSVIFISQNSSNLEINAIRQTDYLVLKPSSLLQLDFERKKIRDIYLSANNQFKRHKNIRGITFVYSEQFTGFIANPLPSFWSQNISKSFRKN